MQYWFIVHTRESYNERNDLIGFVASRHDATKPHLNAVNQMKPGDRLVYYMKAPDSAILGTFKITEGPKFFYEEWSSGIFQFRIEKVEVSEKDPLPIQDLVPKLKFFEGLQGPSWRFKLRTAIQQISEADYLIIENLIKTRSQRIAISHESTQSEPISEPSLLTDHIQMIQHSHDLAKVWELISFVGKREQKSVYQEFSDSVLAFCSNPLSPSFSADIHHLLSPTTA